MSLSSSSNRGMSSDWQPYFQWWIPSIRRSDFPGLSFLLFVACCSGVGVISALVVLSQNVVDQCQRRGVRKRSKASNEGEGIAVAVPPKVCVDILVVGGEGYLVVLFPCSVAALASECSSCQSGCRCIILPICIVSQAK